MSSSVENNRSAKWIKFLFPYSFFVHSNVRYYFLCSGMASKSTIRHLPLWAKDAMAIIGNNCDSLEFLCDN
jgi:hypothetical protein